MTKRLSTLVILVFTISSLTAQGVAAATSPSDSCGQFVQQFYDWYLAREKALMMDKSEETALEAALSEKAGSFRPELVQALKDDLAASKKSPGEIVGLDFDPFLNSQEEEERCVVGKVHQKGEHYLVEVFDILEGKKDSKPDGDS